MFTVFYILKMKMVLKGANERFGDPAFLGSLVTSDQ